MLPPVTPPVLPLAELEEQSSPWSPLNAKTNKHPKSPPKSDCSRQPVIGRDKPDTRALEELKLLAEKEKHAALRLQEEVDICNPQVNHVEK